MTLAVTGARSPRGPRTTPPARLVLTDQTFAVAPGQPWRVELDVDGALADGRGDVAHVDDDHHRRTAPGDTTPAAPAQTAPADAVDAALRVTAGRPAATRHDLTEVLDGAPAVVTDTFVQPIAPTSTGPVTDR